jgi:hypothetical protein
MSNSVITPTIFAKEATMVLNNNLQMAKEVYRGLESDFGNSINGYSVGDTISIRKPTDFTVRSGANVSNQDVVEGKTSLTVNIQEGVDFSFTSKELTLNIKELSDRVIKPAMIQLANSVDAKLMALYKDVNGLVGTAGQTINSFADFAAAPQRLDELAVPADRVAALSPADSWGLVGSQTALYMSDVAKDAYRNGKLGQIGGVDTFSSQNVQTHTVGVATGTPLVNGANQTSTYANVKDTNTQTLNTDGWTNSTTGILKQGDVITIANVYAVNPVTKAKLPFLKTFVVTADVDSGATTGPAALTISPAIITSGAFQNVDSAPADNAAITVVSGTGGTGYRQNMVFNRNAFALAMVPMVAPPGAVDVARQSFEGTSVRVIPYYTGSTDVSAWRLDILYGVKTIDPRLAVRLYGAA